MERIQKILARRGVASRREAESMILAGRVALGGKTCVLGDTADPDTRELTLDGVAVAPARERIYLLLHKPRGFVTTMKDDQGRRTVSQLVADCGQRVYPVGRLDMDSEGLLLMTNDGDFALKLAHPRYQVKKTYRAYVTGFSQAALRRLQEPMELDDHALKIPQVAVEQAQEGSARLRITISEGRNRQVRRMCQMAGMHVTRLIRIRQGPLRLGDLPRGKWRYLTDTERRELEETAAR